MAGSTQKPRTPRKRPNQTYNEAAALLSTACPTIFSITKKNNNQSKLPGKHNHFLNEPPELLSPFPVTELQIKMKPSSSIRNPTEIESNSSSMELSEGYQDDFDTESILDEEIEKGIDGIMGNSKSIMGGDEVPNEKSCFSFNFDFNYNTCYGYPMDLGFAGNLQFNFGFGLRKGARALKNEDERNWWSFPAVNVMSISPPASVELTKMETESGNLIPGEESLSVENGHRLLLKLNYEKVLNAWSDKASPLPESPGSDIHRILSQIDLFSEDGGLREARVFRYKEKGRTRLYSKKIRYQVRKFNAHQRPRSKGRFVRRPNSPTCEET